MDQEILARNNVRVFGHGTQPMMFAHGFGCDQNMWRFVTPAFEDDYQIILFDFVGSGHSDLHAYNPERYSNLKGYAQDVLDICAALDLTNVVFVGHSVSSSIGMLASIRQPERFEHLVLVAPSPCYINDPPDYVGGFERADVEDLLEMMDKNYLGWSSVMAPMVMQNGDQPELTEELQESFCSTDPEIARRFAQATFFADNRSDLPKVTIPSLIMQCSQDALAPRSVGEYLQRHLRQSTMRVLQATGHCPHLSHPGETVEIIKAYLAAHTQ